MDTYHDWEMDFIMTGQEEQRELMLSGQCRSDDALRYMMTSLHIGYQTFLEHLMSQQEVVMKTSVGMIATTCRISIFTFGYFFMMFCLFWSVLN